MENTEIRLNTNKHPFIMLYHDFIKCDFLDWNEKDLYIILLMYAGKDSRQCFPSISELCKISCRSKNTILKAISGLENKKILKKEKRITKNGQTSNLYTLYDIDTMWENENIDEVKRAVDEFEERKMIEALTAKGYCISRKEEPESAPGKVQNQAQSNNNIFADKDIIINTESQVQAERYTMEQIRQLFDYDAMTNDNMNEKQEIDSVMDILHTTMNTMKPTIRIAKEDKPAMVVIGKLMKLNKDSIMYAIKKFSGQTERIMNPTAYMLTILYNAPEQFNLDIQNQVSHDMANWDTYNG